MHHNLSLPPAWPQHSGVQVDGFVLPHDGRPDEMKGRALLTLGTSGFELTLRPTSAELRALAALCQQLADGTDIANVPPFGAPRAVWPAGCTHLPGVPA